MEAMNRIKYINALKGFAAICVVIGHISNGYMGEHSASTLYYDIFNAVYAFHMPLFFVISGFLFGRTYFRDGQIDKSRIKAQVIRLACLYLFYSLILGGSKILFDQYVVNQVTPKDLLLIPVKPLELYWYLFVLIIYYFIFSRKFIIRLNSAVVLVITLAMGIASWWIPHRQLFDANRLVYYHFFFYLGIALNKRDGILKKKAAVFVPLPCILALYILFWNRNTQLNQTLIVNQALGIGCSIFLFAAFQQLRFLGENPLFLLTGRYGLEIYLLHTFILTACRALFHHWNVENPVLILFASTAAGVLIPILFGMACKMLRIHRFLFNPYKGRKQKEQH